MPATGTFSPAIVLIRTTFPDTYFKEKVIEILISVLTEFALHVAIHHSFFSHRNVEVVNCVHCDFQAERLQTDFEEATGFVSACGLVDFYFFPPPRGLLSLEISAITCILALHGKVFFSPTLFVRYIQGL